MKALLDAVLLDVGGTLIEEAPQVYYRPPYVGSSGWIGVELDQVNDEVLDAHLRQAWQLVTRKGKSNLSVARRMSPESLQRRSR